MLFFLFAALQFVLASPEDAQAGIAVEEPVIEDASGVFLFMTEELPLARRLPPSSSSSSPPRRRRASTPTPSPTVSADSSAATTPAPTPEKDTAWALLLMGTVALQV